MPLTILRFKPGIDTETTPVLSEAGWNNSQLIRWRAGLPEKLGGWAHLNQVALVGTGRGKARAVFKNQRCQTRRPDDRRDGGKNRKQ